MATFTSSFIKIAIASLYFAANVKALSNNEYFRPTGTEVSGQVNATTPYVRSPCPALNTLANHGFLPRNGYNITRAQYKKAIMEVFHMPDLVASHSISSIPETCSLNFLSTHNMIEHDASLVHVDISYGTDPAQPSTELFEDLISRAVDGVLTVKSVGSARKARELSCSKKSVKCVYGMKQRILALGQASFLLNILGRNEQMLVEHAKSFLLDERFPSDWVRSPTEVNNLSLLSTALKVQAEITFG